MMRLENQGSTGPRKGSSTKKQKNKEGAAPRATNSSKVLVVLQRHPRARREESRTHPGKTQGTPPEPQSTTPNPKQSQSTTPEPQSTPNPKETRNKPQGREATTKELGVSATHPEQSRRYIINFLMYQKVKN